MFCALSPMPTVHEDVQLGWATLDAWGELGRVIFFGVEGAPQS